MRILDHTQVLQELARALNRPCIYVNFNCPDDADYSPWDEMTKAAPYLHLPENGQVLADGSAIIVCDTEDEMWQIYNQTVGDDGPTTANPYTGPARVYALTCTVNGELGPKTPRRN